MKSNTQQSTGDGIREIPLTPEQKFIDQHIAFIDNYKSIEGFELHLPNNEIIILKVEDFSFIKNQINDISNGHALLVVNEDSKFNLRPLSICRQ